MMSKPTAGKAFGGFSWFSAEWEAGHSPHRITVLIAGASWP